MLDNLIHFDYQVFLSLNNLGCEPFDAIWLYITNEKSWIPFHFLLLLICLHTLGWKRTLLMGVCISLMIACTDNLSNISKDYFERFRPCRTVELTGKFRYLLDGCATYGFFSAHAASNMALGLFLGSILKDYYKYTLILGVFWGLMIGYSRLYVGAHFPADVVVGWLIGGVFALLFLWLYRQFDSKI